MLWFVCSLLAVTSVVLAIQLFKVRRFSQSLTNSIRERQLFLVDGDSKLFKRLDLASLVTDVNLLIERERTLTMEETGHADQIESTLGAIQEALFIYDEDRTVEFANKAAVELFERGRSLKGAHLDSILRSHELNQFLDAQPSKHLEDVSEVKVGEGADTRWFEASVAEVTGMLGPGSSAYLLVLHNVTRLKRLEMVRREFVANVSHELRTPLTIIKGFAETLEEDNKVLAVDARARFIGKIVKNAERLNLLVEDLLTLSRLESKQNLDLKELCSINDLFEEVLETYRPRIDTGRQEIRVDDDPSIKRFVFDRFRIQQVLDNLLENAFRYAPNFTKLQVGARLNELDRQVECWVSDDGPGIPRKDLDSVFERFYRVDKGRSRDRGGTGLGLSIMKHIILQHGGRVWVESQEGQGSTFWFSLPYRTRLINGA